ncbi:PucR family transcriptional regulator [Mumia sp. zg.B53]|uniref:PucR family transcriptional regulator n=1 Tax=Mumia sp. zg.B53 TaxID=2855449 RepID=UPI001C6E8EB6|nr:PucR family transcriptional regulator [Mumia sp. zg.B53]MBW9214688.1 PucR family transcriptional regulator [Mumia sp. zg.B53]
MATPQPEDPYGVTLAWLLAQEALGLRLVEPEAVPTVSLGWAHAIELVDPTPFLGGGELVLTTGLRMPRDHAGQEAYVERLAAAGVVGVAFGIGVRFDTIPPGLREACRRSVMPLIEVPLPTPFVAITQAVAAHRAEQQNAVMHRAVGFQRQMTRATLDEGVAGLVTAVARELRAAVVVLDELEHPVASAGETPELGERVATELVALVARPGRASITVVSDTGTLVIQRLGGLERPSGWLAVEVPGALSVGDRLLLNQAVSLLTLQRERPRELVDARHRLGATVLELLLDDEVVAPSIVRHLRHFGFEPGEPVRMLVASAGTGRTSPRDLVAHALEAAALAHVETDSADGVLVLLHDRDAAAGADAVVDALGRAGRHDVVVGVSGALPTERAAAGRAAAAHAAASARASHEPVGWYGTLTLEAILADDLVRARVATLAASPLAPLLDSRTERERVLLDSLEVFLRHNGSWETASRALGVHRHTLRHRMTRVEELTGARLDVAEDRVALLLGLLARER